MDERTTLYRIFGENDLLLYVGISNDFGRRWEQEAKAFSWWDEHRQMSVEWHPSRPEAEAAEVAAIETERPKYNIRHAVPEPLINDYQVREITSKERVKARQMQRYRAKNPELAARLESRRCVDCGAAVGELCRTVNGRITDYHGARKMWYRSLVRYVTYSPAEMAAGGYLA